MRSEIIAISTAKARLLELTRRVDSEGRAYILTTDGVPRGALVPMEDYEALLETEDIVSSDATTSALKRALADAKAGRLWKRDKAGKWVKVGRRR